MSRTDGLVLLLCGVAVAGCSSAGGGERTPISIRDFAHPPASLKTDVVAMSQTLVATPDAGAAESDGAERDASGTGGVAVGRTEVESSPAEERAQGGAGARQPAARRVDVGQSWPIEGLVGQVNGRPIFIDAFFNPIEDRLLALASMPDRVEARRAIVAVVSREFKETVDSELIVAEAESQLSPEQQQGLFAWLRSLQEETIAERGGSRAAAEQSLESEGADSLEDFLSGERDKALAIRLLSQRIEPRTIVSWRDVVQEYERREKEFNPPPAIRIGRIRFDPATEGESVAKVKAMVAEGKGFSAIAREIGVAEGGFWNRYELPANGIAGLDLSDAIKQRLDGLKVDQVSEPIEARGFISWLAIIEVETQEQRSLYDRTVQLALEDELRGRRRLIERSRYIGTLRSRWVTDDIDAMERRLVDIALQRYWR
jgi:hypothetical protein